jgi:hypothetical protein
MNLNTRQCHESNVNKFMEIYSFFVKSKKFPCQATNQRKTRGGCAGVAVFAATEMPEIAPGFHL